MPAARAYAPTSRWNAGDRKSTRLNSSHVEISYAVFCLKKKKIVTQLAGRSGREDHGHVIRQNHQPDSRPVALAARHAVEEFLAGELERTRFFFFNDTATTEIYTLSLHDALPI